MKKTLLTILLFGFVLLGITGCGKTNKSTTINITLNDNTNSVEIKDGDVLTYTLMGNEYEFKITDINDNEVSIKVNQYGLTNTSSLISKDNKFTIEKGNKLELHTQTTDYQETITFEYQTNYNFEYGFQVKRSRVIR